MSGTSPEPSTNLTTSSNTAVTLSTISLREGVEKIAVLHGRLETADGQPTKFCVRRDMAPTDLERRQISAVNARLERELAPWAPEQRNDVETIVSRLLVGFEKGRGSETAAAVLNGEYVDAVKGMALAEIRSAADRFRSATTLLPWDPDWRPSPARFATEVRRGAVETRLKLVHGRRVLAAEVYDVPSAEDRAAVLVAAKKFIEDRRTFEAEAEARRSSLSGPAASDRALRGDVAGLTQLDGDVVLRDLNERLDARTQAGAQP